MINEFFSPLVGWVRLYDCFLIESVSREYLRSVDVVPVENYKADSK